MSFVSELKRRNVFRVATAYIIGAWIIMQVIDVMSPALKLPDWVASLFAVMLLIGFPIAVVISWVYEVTENGLKKTVAIDESTSIVDRTAQRLDYLIIAGLVLVGGLVVWQQVAPKSGDDADAALAVATSVPEAGSVDNTDTTPPLVAATISPSSVAVLPFVDLSPQGDQEYFADGISEEILNVLAGVEALKVAGRTSSFSFKGRNEDLRKIGEVLGVANILEGSVRKQGNRIRVTAQLIKADDGFHLWSQTFDNDLDDIFAVQDEIAAQILSAMTSQFADQAPTTTRADIRAYDAYLEAKDLLYSRQPDPMRRAVKLLDRAIAIDANYAAPYAQRALAESLLSDAPGSYGDTPVAQALPRAIEFADKALALDPGLADAHAVRGLLYLDTAQLEQAIGSLRRAVDINPNHLDARNWLALALGSNGRYRDSAEQQVALFEFDPLYPPIASNVVTQLLRIGEVDRAAQLVDRMKRFEGNQAVYDWARSNLLGATGDVAEAIKLSDPHNEKFPNTVRGSGLAFARLGIGDIDGARSYGYPFVDMYADLVAGETEEALGEARKALNDNPDYYATQIDYIIMLSATGQNAELVRFYHDTYGDDLIFENSLFQPFTAELPPFGQVAYALKSVGNTQDYEAIMRRWRTAIDIARAGGADNFGFNLADAQWYALQGDTDKALFYMEKIARLRKGLLGFWINISFLADLLSDNPEFQQLQASNLRRINEERDKLGLSSIAF